MSGTILILSAAAGDTISVTAAGNIIVPSTRVLNSVYDRLTLLWMGSKWVELAYADNA